MLVQNVSGYTKQDLRPKQWLLSKTTFEKISL